MNISVVIPMYNASSTISDVLTSVVQQDYDRRIEIIVIDDGSTDSCSNIVNDFIGKNDFDIKLINKPNGGVSSARNLGIENASYDWIAFLDSDDIWLPSKLRRQVEVVESLSSNVDFIGCARNNESLRIGLRKIKTLHKAVVRELLVKMFPQTSTALIRKSVLQELGGYDTSFTHAEDGELWIRICTKYRFYYLPESLVITGGGKPNFGHSGLSANLQAMSDGGMKILNMAIKRGDVSHLEGAIFRVFYYFKSLRRVIIRSLN
ncbi:glycosyltransferase family 2 protein [Vibrio tapetis]|uniref:Glycosyltransferase n=1 Tax=Vibrio tapetis subsp. tapetis TaxID=1671868 RepID=A0A2N8ZGL8_9VIBR|nr:glycosyltransferase family A protein [Vibrio tapetis]SON51005.1 Glycosyltransferase [Vibrio tapetis subsp. tapetis]